MIFEIIVYRISTIFYSLCFQIDAIFQITREHHYCLPNMRYVEIRAPKPLLVVL